jgi:chromosomal replication initiation ATPase DnaA
MTTDPAPDAIAALPPQLFPRDAKGNIVLRTVMLPCWVCGVIFDTHGAPIEICRGCEGDGTTVEQRIAMRDSTNRAATWAVIQSKRKERPAFSVNGAPTEYQRALPTAQVAEWARKPSQPVLLLMGQTGRGKTYQAWAAMGILQRVYRTVAVKCAALARVDSPAMRVYREAGALLLDDLGARTTPGALAAALELIDERQENHAPTIITTNMEFAPMYELDPRMASRLALALTIRMEGPDRRLRQSITDRFTKAKTA